MNEFKIFNYLSNIIKQNQNQNVHPSRLPIYKQRLVAYRDVYLSEYNIVVRKNNVFPLELPFCRIKDYVDISLVPIRYVRQFKKQLRNELFSEVRRKAEQYNKTTRKYNSKRSLKRKRRQQQQNERP